MRHRSATPQPPSPALARLGLATPPPFVGRVQEIAELHQAFRDAPIAVVNGAVGAGKTRLAGAFADEVTARGELVVTRISCMPGDLGVSVVARCERAMDRMPGSLPRVFATEARLLILDDVHHLPAVEVTRLLRSLLDVPGPARLLLLTRDVLPLPREEVPYVSFELSGLETAAAHELWTHLEGLYGPTSHGSCDQALAKTRAMPLALRREYARSRYGSDAWERADLGEASLAALQAVCVARVPAAPAAVSALTGMELVEPALIDLVSRQLIDPLESGRFAVHDVVRDQVLAEMEAERRTELERRAAELVRGSGRGVSPQRPGWAAGDDGAIALLDDADRMREVLMHLVAAGDYESALEELSTKLRAALARGAAGDVLAQISSLHALGIKDERLTRAEAQIAVRHGRIAEALESDAKLEPSLHAYLQFRSGDVERAHRHLDALCRSEDADRAALAASSAAEIDLEMGRVAEAEARIQDAFARRDELSGFARSHLHLAFAQVESFRGSPSGTRAALARAASSADDSELLARVEVRRLRNLVSEGRVSEARSQWRRIESVVAEVDCVPLRDELGRCEALLDVALGAAPSAVARLRALITAARQRGDEVSALRSDVELASILCEMGELAAAAEVLTTAQAAARRTQLASLDGRLSLLLVRISLAELRVDLASDLLDGLDEASLPEDDCKSARALRREVAVRRGESPKTRAESVLEEAQLALIASDAATALAAAHRASVEAERLGQHHVVASAMSMVARLELARGASEKAMAAASRAAREAQRSGKVTARGEALLALASLSRDKDNVCEAATYARDAMELAAGAGLPVLRVAATMALEVISGIEGESEALHPACAATVSEGAKAAAEALLADLGFGATRPFRCVGSGGAESFVASASPELLGMGERSLVVDAVRQCIVRDGDVIADLRRRSLLKRLLFLFAASPEHVFSKEDIVEKVWEVEYHPLRHDAALFTNIMRIRRLLGGDGSEVIQVSEEGYFLSAPKDFLYVEAVASA